MARRRGGGGARRRVGVGRGAGGGVARSRVGVGVTASQFFLFLVTGRNTVYMLIPLMQTL